MPRLASVAAAVFLTFAAIASAGSPRGAETLPGTIAFSAGTQATGYQVFVAKPSGRIVQVTHDAVRRSVPGSPIWSPDGSRLLVVGDDGIYVVHGDGSSELRVAGLANGYAAQSVAWSPDSRRIAFGEADSLYVVNADGSGGLERLARPAHAPSWSADGRQIVYSGADTRRRPSLLIVNTVGRPHPRPLMSATHGGPRKGYPWATWSPDGSRIAFEYSSNDYSPLGGWVYSVRPDGADLRLLYRGDIGPWSPNWSPDGRTLIVTRGFNAIWKMFLVRADGTATRQFHGCAKGCGLVSWFPDGSRIGYMEARAVYVARADGSGRRLIARTHSPYDGFFSVSPDGSTVAYTDGRRSDHNRTLYVVGADGRGRRVVAHSPTIRYWSPAWRPAGR